MLLAGGIIIEIEMLHCEYHYEHESEQYSFYMVPKALFTDARFKDLSYGAKILYGILLDRMSLSRKNGWVDERQRVYIIFTISEIMEMLGCGKQKACDLLAELSTEKGKGIGLVEKKRLGLGKPSILYVKKFIFSDYKAKHPEVRKPEIQKYGNRTSGSTDNPPTEVRKTECNNTYPSNPDSSNPDPPPPIAPPNESLAVVDNEAESNVQEYREFIECNIEYDILCERYERTKVDEIVGIILETVISTEPTIRVNKQQLPADMVRSRLLELDSEHIIYVFDYLDDNTQPIYSVRNYLLSVLYNAPTSMEAYYRAKVKHDLYGG